MGNLPTLVKFSAALLSCILDYTRADNELQGNKNLLYIYIMVFQTSSTRGYPNLLDSYGRLLTFNIWRPCFLSNPLHNT